MEDISTNIIYKQGVYTTLFESAELAEQDVVGGVGAAEMFGHDLKQHDHGHFICILENFSS